MIRYDTQNRTLKLYEYASGSVGWGPHSVSLCVFRRALPGSAPSLLLLLLRIDVEEIQPHPPVAHTGVLDATQHRHGWRGPMHGDTHKEKN